MAEGETLGDRIRRERLAKEMTQRELAERVGVGVPHISKIEANRESPSDELLANVAEQLSVDADELFLAAHRLPAAIVDDLAADPAAGAQFLRTWSGAQNRKGR